MRYLPILAAALMLGAATAPAMADDTGLAGHYQVRLRGLAVLPDASATVTVSGSPLASTTSATHSFVPEIDGTYFITDNIAVELIAATTKHSVHNSVAGNVGSVWLLPPTVTVQYHFNPTGTIRPYVGAGLNYTLFYSAHSTAYPPISFSNNFGFAVQAGVDIPVGDGPYFLNLDVKKLFLSTTMKAAGGVIRAKADLDPLIMGMGFGIRF